MDGAKAERSRYAMCHKLKFNLIFSAKTGGRTPRRSPIRYLWRASCDCAGTQSGTGRSSLIGKGGHAYCAHADAGVMNGAVLEYNHTDRVGRKTYSPYLA